VPDPAPAAQDEASARFEALWRQAREEKAVAVTKTKKIEVDLSPVTILKYLREVADTSHAKGDMNEDQYKLVIQSSKQLEAAFSGLPVAKFYEYLDEVKDRLRDIRERHGLDKP
jgi:hypothetical protein